MVNIFLKFHHIITFFLQYFFEKNEIPRAEIKKKNPKPPPVKSG